MSNSKKQKINTAQLLFSSDSTSQTSQHLNSHSKQEQNRRQSYGLNNPCDGLHPVRLNNAAKLQKNIVPTHTVTPLIRQGYRLLPSPDFGRFWAFAKAIELPFWKFSGRIFFLSNWTLLYSRTLYLPPRRHSGGICYDIVTKEKHVKQIVHNFLLFSFSFFYSLTTYHWQFLFCSSNIKHLQRNLHWHRRQR